MKTYLVKCYNGYNMETMLTIRANDESEIEFRIPNIYTLISYSLA